MSSENMDSKWFQRTVNDFKWTLVIAFIKIANKAPHDTDTADANQ